MDSKNINGLLNPVRMKIIQYLIQNQTATPKMISEALPDIPTASLYRHIKKLNEEGIIEVHEENKIRGTVEKVYRLKHNPIQQVNEAAENADTEELFQMFYSFTMSLLTEFQNYLGKENYDLKKDQVGFRSYALYLNNEEYDELVGEWRNTLIKYLNNEPTNNRTLRKLSLVLMPGMDQ